jgi:hypothetical protein
MLPVNPLNGQEPKGVSAAPQQGHLAKLEKAADDALLDSLHRDVELRKTFVQLYDKWTNLTKTIPNLDSTKPLKDSLTPSQADEFNMLTSQMRYLQLSLYDEVIKRREIRQLKSLILVEEKQEGLWADMVASGGVPNDLPAAMTTIRGKLKEQGVAIHEWEVVLNALTSVQENEDARTIPFKNFVDQVRVAKNGPTPESDNIGFFMRDDLKTSPAFKIFIDRLDAGVKSRDPDAIAAAPFVLAELKSRNGN